MFIGEQLWLYPIQFSLFPLLTSPFVANKFSMLPECLKSESILTEIKKHNYQAIKLLKFVF